MFGQERRMKEREKEREEVEKKSTKVLGLMSERLRGGRKEKKKIKEKGVREREREGGGLR